LNLSAPDSSFAELFAELTPKIYSEIVYLLNIPVYVSALWIIC